MSLQSEEAIIHAGIVAAQAEAHDTWQSDNFRRAHTLAVKAIGKLAAYIDTAEHARCDAEAVENEKAIPKLLADLVRCALKMADEKEISLADAYLDRCNELFIRWRL